MIEDYNPDPYVVESFSLFYKPVNVYPLDLNATQTDTLYGESKGRVYPTTPVQVPIYYRFDVDEKALTKFGIDRKEDLFIGISVSVANQAGWTPKIGDIVEVGSEKFEITTLKPQRAMNGKVYILVGTAKRWQSG